MKIIPQPLKQMAISERDASASPAAPALSDNATSQFARIVTLAVFKTSLDVSGWDANDEAAWDALETSSDLFIFGPVRGMLPEPSQNTAAGYGFLDVRHKNHQYDIPIQHQDADGQFDNWDKIMSQPGDWSAMPIFEDLTGYLFLGKDLVPIPMTFNPRPTSESEDIGDERVMRINMQFKTKRMPYILSDLDAANFKLF